MRDIILFLDSSIFGGIEAHIIELAKLLKKEQLPVSILFYQEHNNQQLYRALDDINCSYKFLNGKTFSLFKFLKDHKNSVLHTHGYKAGIIGRITCKLLNHPCVSTYHAGEKGAGKVRIYNWLDHLTSRFSKNLVVSDHLLEHVKNGQFIANFIVPQNYQRKPESDVYHIAFIGRLSFEKGPDRFINLARYFEQNSRLQFHIYGSGPMENTLKNNAPSNVTFHGHQSAKTFWQDIDVLMLCSREEGLPMVLLEAIDRKILCICHPVGAISSVIINNQSGIITDEQSQEQLVAKLNTLINLTTKEKNYLVNNATTRLERLFSGHQQLSILTKLYFG